MNLSHEMIKDNNDLIQLFFSGIDADNALLPAHWHNHLEIICLDKGHMTAYINETSYELSVGDILIVNPKDIHYTHAHGDCHYYLMQIPTVHLERISPEWKLLYFEEYLSNNPDPNSLNHQISSLIHKLALLHDKRKNGYHLLMLTALYELLYTLYTKGSSILSARSKSRTDRDFQRIEQSMQYAKKNYKKQITLAEAAAHVCVTPEYFCRLFKKYTGQTYFTYLAQIRLLHFYQDLLQTEDSINYLLEKNGITNYKQFMHMFKEAYGTTPHRLRMQLGKS